MNTYGPRMRMDDGRAVPTFVGQALADELLTAHIDGSQARPICYVGDLIDGLMRLLFAEEMAPVNLGTDYELPMREMAEAVVAAWGSASEIHFVDRPTDDPQARWPDPTLAEQTLGWRATTDGPADGALP